MDKIIRILFWKNLKRTTLCVLLLPFVTACGTEQIENLVENSVGGNVSGLTGTLVLQNNNSDEISITSNGDFTFPSSLGITNRYQVTIVQNPVGQICSVANASGVMSFVNITDVVIVCSTVYHSVSGVVNGLTGTVIIENNSSDAQTLSMDGVFTFPDRVALSATYSVQVTTQPNNQTCTVINGSGTINGDVTDIVIDCTP